jgi:hypothetical protein
MINKSHTNFNLVSDKHYYCADTEIEIHILRCLNVARKFDAAKYAETIDIKILGIENTYPYNRVESHSMWYDHPKTDHVTPPSERTTPT